MKNKTTTLTAAIWFNRLVDQNCHIVEDATEGKKLVMLEDVVSISIDEQDMMHILNSHHKTYSFPASIVERLNTITETSRN